MWRKLTHLVVTDEYQLTRGEYVRVLARHMLQQRAVLLLVLAGFAAWGWLRFGLHLYTLLFSVCLIFYPLLLFGYAWRFASTSDNRLIYERRRVTFDEEFVTVSVDDGSESRIRWDHITRVERTREHFRLHLSRSQWIIVPLRAFASHDDVAAVEALLQNIHQS